MGWFRLRTILLMTAASAVPLTAALGQNVINLDTITVLATKLKERAIEALAGVSVVTRETIEMRQPARLEEVFAGVPGVWINTNADDLGVGFNVRGLQDYGRVAVVVDGARQNFQVAQHGPEGKVYLDPELISEAEVARGPVANIYGSGAIGGVVSLSTKTADDILDPGERFGAVFNGVAGTNQGPFLGSLFLAGRPTEDFDILLGASVRHLDDYTDGNGDKVVNTGSDTYALLAKTRLRPLDGHEITLGVTHQHALFKSGFPGDPADTTDGGTNYDNTVDNSTLTGKYTVSGLDPLVDLSASAFWNHGSQESVVTEQYCTWFGPPLGPCHDFTGPVGTISSYNLDTLGYDVHNSSRFDAMGLQHTLTFGTDLFADTVTSTGTNAEPDAGHLLTASGDRQAYGGFAEWKLEYGTLIDVIGALRYDGFHMASADNDTSGQRISPKITVGVTPVDGFTLYGTYAEGYRAPSINEAFATGEHPGGIFQFLPNPSLGAETGHTLEAGINVQRDGIFTDSDTFRFKGNIFRNEVTDFINLEAIVTPPECTFPSPFPGPPFLCYQYQNIDEALIQGIELEGSYDAGKWFMQASGTFLEGKDVATGEHLASVLPGQAMVTFGGRFLDDKLVVAPNWRWVSGGSFYDDEGDLHEWDPYQLLGLSISYQPNKNTTASLVFDNILNAFYTPYLQNKPSPGFTVKGSLRVKLGN
jgi:hemoglobin/transferrin/lactoferrin receptor protein